MRTKYTLIIGIVVLAIIIGVGYAVASNRDANHSAQVQSSGPADYQAAQPAATPDPTPPPPANTSTRSGGPSPSEAGKIKTSFWGGEHISLAVDVSSSMVEFDCAHGSIDQAIITDSKGNFTANGSYSMEHGGPVMTDEPNNSHPAVYSGTVNGAQMTLIITLTDTKQKLGPFNLTQGVQGRVFKCL